MDKTKERIPDNSGTTGLGGTGKPDGDSSEKTDMVKVLFKNTYIGEYGIFYKKNRYTITKKLAEIMKNDLEVVKE
jgi:hypothetical protein